MKKIVLCLLACGIVSLNAYPEVNRIIAKVNNQVITSKDLDDFCKMLAYKLAGQESELSPDDPNFRREALDKLIEDKLIASQAHKEKIEVPTPWVEGKLNEMMATYPSRADFEASIVERGLNLTALKERIREQFMARQMIEKYVRTYITISPNETYAYFQEHPEKFTPPVMHVFWIAASRDKNVLVALGKLIKEKGIGEAEKSYSAMLVRTEAAKEDLREEVSELVDQLKEGNFTIRKLDGEDHLIYLEKTTPGGPVTFEQAKERIHSFLWTKKFKERYQTWIASLKAKATIKMYGQ